MPTRSEARAKAGSVAAEPAERAIDTALARGVLYRALALGFGSEHGAACAALLSDAGRAALGAAADLIDAQRRSAGPLAPTVRALARAAPPSPAGLAAAHARLFGHSHGLVPPFETDYGAAGAFRQPQELADIAGYYLAFGLRAPSGIDERADHIACECEFMDFLARKEAFLLESSRAAGGSAAADGETLAAVRDAARGFLRAHLGRFGRAFAAGLMREDAGGFHGALGAVLFHFLGLECERLGVPAGPPTIELRPPAPDDAPMACGGACRGGPELAHSDH